MKSSFNRPWESFKKTLDFHHAQIEALVEKREDLNPGLSEAALYSSLEDLWNIFQSSRVQGKFVDLGCGIGLPTLLYGFHHPEREAVGVEFSQARLEVAQRHRLKNTTFIRGDLLHCAIPRGDTYYFYFPTGPVLDRILFELRQLPYPVTLIVVESHGDLIPRFEKEDWLTVEEKIPLITPRHHSEAYLFKSHPEIRHRFSLHDVSFQKKHLLIDDEWLGESLGLEWQGEDLFNLKIPPRTIQEKQVSQIFEIDALTPAQRIAIEVRRLGELQIESESGFHLGFIRKIGFGERFYVELSSGEKLEWSRIKSISWEHQLCYESSSPRSSFPPVL
jgi:SAM-dependent methyltransferase